MYPRASTRAMHKAVLFQRNDCDLAKNFCKLHRFGIACTQSMTQPPEMMTVSPVM